MPKCASSTLQAFFYANYHRFAAQGVLYPRTGCEEFGYQSHRPLHRSSIPEIGNLVAGVAEEADNANCDTILISSEEILNTGLKRKETRALVDALKSSFGVENVEFLFFVRDHLSFIESAFAQFIRGGLFSVNERDFFKKERADIAGYAEVFHDTNGFDFYCYSDFLTRFMELMSLDKGRVLSIHREDGNGKSILQRSCDLLGIKDITAERRQNTRLNEKQLFLLLHARKRHGIQAVRNCSREIELAAQDVVGFRAPNFRMNAEFLKRVRATADLDKAFFDVWWKI